MKHGIILTLIIFLGCNKENSEPETDSICANCIYGKWELTYCEKIIDGDTIQVFENGKLYELSSGVRLSQYEGHLILEFQEGKLIYDELTEGYINGEDDRINCEEDWKWINTAFSKTHLKFRIRFSANNDIDIFRIKELSNDELILEYRRVWSIEYYSLLKFRKIEDNEIIADNYEQRIIQKPSNIIGSWELEECLDKTNDSIFSKLINDTLAVQYFILVGRPPVYQKVTDRYIYILSMTMDDSGNLIATEDRDEGINKIEGYWYWTDDDNPHKNIYIEPTIANLITDYELRSIDESSFELIHTYHGIIDDTSTQVIYYRFRRNN
jgi:hypothetical protein